MPSPSLQQVVQTALRTSDFGPVAQFVPSLRLSPGEDTPEVVGFHERAVKALEVMRVPDAQRAAADLLDYLSAAGRTPAGKSETLVNLVVLLS